MPAELNFLPRAAVYTNGDLEHQIAAFDYAQNCLSTEELNKFIELFRNQGDRHFLANFPLISQRDAVGDWDKDGRLDKYQTCQVTCCAMVIEYLTGVKVTPKELDRKVRTNFGSRYVHSNLVKLLKLYGVHSDFDVATTHDEIKANIRSGNPVIVSLNLTHSGHIVVVTGYDDDKFCYQIHDPYGECFPINSERTKWRYEDKRSPYLLSYRSFNAVNANGAGNKLHWGHLCKKIND